MILGLYYLMLDPLYDPEQHGLKVKVFRDTEEVLMAMNSGGSFNWFEKALKEGERSDQLGRGLRLHERIKLRLDHGIIETTPGRVIFNTIVPKEMGFQNYSLRKKNMGDLVLACYKKVGLEATVRFLDNLKNLGFAEGTKAAPSMGVCDIRVPTDKTAVIESGYARIETVKKQYEAGIITDGERKPRSPIRFPKNSSSSSASREIPSSTRYL
jgi:DNA-directed RNA polymerase subunit beta'